jgi:hypothetical protein
MQNAEDLECHEQKRAGKHALPQKWLPIMPPNAMLILVQMPRFINRQFFLKKKQIRSKQDRKHPSAASRAPYPSPFGYPQYGVQLPCSHSLS